MGEIFLTIYHVSCGHMINHALIYANFIYSDYNLAPVVQRPDNFIQWISHYPTVSICAKILVFRRVQANIHTLTTV